MALKHVKGIDAIVMVRPTKSPVIFHQQLGRALSSGGNQAPVVFDLCNNFGLLGEWPEHIEVSHESSRFKSRRYVPRVNSANKSSANPVDGIWCSHCGWAGVIAQDMTDLDEVTEPQFDILAEDVPTFCPKCGSLLMY